MKELALRPRGTADVDGPATGLIGATRTVLWTPVHQPLADLLVRITGIDAEERNQARVSAQRSRHVPVVRTKTRDEEVAAHRMVWTTSSRPIVRGVPERPERQNWSRRGVRTGAGAPVVNLSENERSGCVRVEAVRVLRERLLLAHDRHEQARSRFHATRNREDRHGRRPGGHQIGDRKIYQRELATVPDRVKDSMKSRTAGASTSLTDRQSRGEAA